MTDIQTVRVALMVRLEAKPERASEVAALLRDGRSIVAEEAATPYWFAIQIGPTTFGIFDAFAAGADRQAHLEGKLAQTLMSRAGELLATAPVIEPVDVLAAKLR